MKKILTPLLAALLTTACGGTLKQEAGGARQALGAPEAERVLAFVNDPATTFERLDVDCGLRSDSALNIVLARDAAPFESLEALDAVRMVGSWTLDQLSLCADTHLLLALLEGATLAQLDDDCGLRSDAAHNLLAHRDGPDRTAGTDDDDRFDSLAEVDAVAQVGPWTLTRLFECAFAPPAAEPEPTPAPIYDWPATGPGHLLVEDLEAIDPALRELIETTILEVAEQFREPGVYFPVRWSSLDIHAWDGEITGYHVNYLQWIDPEGGIQLYISVALTADYEILDVYADI